MPSSKRRGRVVHRAAATPHLDARSSWQPRRVDGTWNDLIRLARGQHDVVSRGQALALGIPSSTLHRRLVRDGWDIPVPGVAVAPWATPGAHLEAAIAGWAVAPGGGVTGDTALAVHGVRVAFPACPTVVVPHDREGTSRRVAVIIRSRTLRASDVGRHDGIPCVSIHRALLDLAARSPTADLRERLIDLRQQRLLDTEELQSWLEAARGARGRPRLLEAIADVVGSGADSILTRRVEEALQLSGLAPDPYPAVVDVGGRVLHPDITFSRHRVAIECDSLGFHADQAALDRDARKHNAYRLSGWTSLRISWLRARRDLDGFVAEVRRALAQTSPRPRPHGSGGTTPT